MSINEAFLQLEEANVRVFESVCDSIKEALGRSYPREYLAHHAAELVTTGVGAIAGADVPDRGACIDLAVSLLTRGLLLGLTLPDKRIPHDGFVLPPEVQKTIVVLQDFVLSALSGFTHLAARLPNPREGLLIRSKEVAAGVSQSVRANASTLSRADCLAAYTTLMCAALLPLIDPPASVTPCDPHSPSLN